MIAGLVEGQKLVHKFGGVEDYATHEADGVHYMGKTYSSLSKAGMAMLVAHGEVEEREGKFYTKSTGKERSCGGWEFYGLTNPNARTVNRVASETIIDPVSAKEKARAEYEAMLKKIDEQAAAQSPEKLKEKLTSIDAQIAKLNDERGKILNALGQKGTVAPTPEVNLTPPEAPTAQVQKPGKKK